jgi:hypothetical protein
MLLLGRPKGDRSSPLLKEGLPVVLAFPWGSIKLPLIHIAVDFDAAMDSPANEPANSQAFNTLVTAT